MDVLEIPDPGACISRSDVALSLSVLESETPDISISANFPSRKGVGTRERMDAYQRAGMHGSS